MSGRDVMVIAGLALAVLGLMRNQARSKQKSGLYVSGLVVYPIKSCKGISVTSSRLDRMGLAWDRRFLIIGAESNSFITQRQYPKMALITPRFEDNNGKVYEIIPEKPSFLVVSAPEMPDLRIPLQAMDQEGKKDDSPWFNEGVVDAKVWDDVISAQYVGKEADQWFTKYIGCQVRMAATRPGFSHQRNINRTYDITPPGSRIQPAFPDGFPLLVATEASLLELNRRVDVPLIMGNFRPNIIVGGTSGPFAEDFWSRIGVDDQNGIPITLEVVKHCSRCTIPNVEPSSGERRKDGEPTKTLRNFRLVGDAVYFGVNCIHLSLGTIRVQAPMEVLVRHSMDLKDRVNTIRQHAGSSHQPFEG